MKNTALEIEYRFRELRSVGDQLGDDVARFWLEMKESIVDGGNDHLKYYFKI